MAAEGEWTDGEYNFDFTKGEYKKGKKPLHLTAGEKLFLYNLLVRREAPSEKMFFIKNIRRRLGSSFLKEVV
jgi:hypothetical protein